MPDSLVNHILQQRETTLSIQRALTSIPALGPENGGQGEYEKALFIENWLCGAGVEKIEHLDSPDEHVTSGRRPNLICHMPGKKARTLWLFGHMDVVPAGNSAAWHTNPWELSVQGDLIYGRGVEDNQQAITSMMILATALKNTETLPDLSLGLVFMADEETGSRHGLKHLLHHSGSLFGSQDLYIVPDGGSPDGAAIEIAEKAQLWLRFIVTGHQCHASTPERGKNTLVAASELILELDELNRIFDRQNPLFEPPRSTFVPSKHDCNVDAINILPGRDVFYLDCRLLPGLSPEAVLAKCTQITNNVAADYGVKIKVEIAHRQNATSIPPDCLVVRKLSKAIQEIYQITPSLCGIGGATVAAFLREAGREAAVWSCIQNTCHQPNECSSIDATLKDAAVFARILTSSNGI